MRAGIIENRRRSTFIPLLFQRCVLRVRIGGYIGQEEDLVDITSIDGPCTLKPPFLKGAVPRERKNF